MATEFIPIAMAQLWQVTLLILVVAVLSRWLSRRRPHLSHLLWLVVLIKCVTPPVWASPGGVFCWLQPEQQIETPFVENVEWTPVAWDEMLEVENPSTMDFELSDAPFAGVYLGESADAELTAASSVVEPPGDQPLGNRIGNVALVAWAVISGFVLLGVTIRWLRFWRLVRTSPRRDSPELDTMLQTLSKQLGVRRRVRLIVTESLVGPAVVGFFRVTVLIPAVVADKLKGESVAPILAHELLHVRRGDLWVGLLQTVAQALWWFHPLVWWVGRVTSREAERCCDEEVLGELKCDPASYARALLDVLDLKSQLKPVPVFPGVRPVDVTSQRLERIMTLRQGCRRRSPLWCWLVAIGAAALTLPGAAFVVTAQEEESSESNAATGLDRKDDEEELGAAITPRTNASKSREPGSIDESTTHLRNEKTASKIQSKPSNLSKGYNAVQKHGPFLVEFGLTPEYRQRLQPGNFIRPPSSMQITVSHSEGSRKGSSPADGRRLDMRADQNSLRFRDDVLSLMLKGNVELRVENSSATDTKSFFTATADSLEISLPKSPEVGATISFPCRMTEAIVRYGIGGTAAPSMVRAEEIMIELNSKTFEISSLNASKVDSLQVSDVKQKIAKSQTVFFAENRELLSQWDTIRRRRSFQNLVSPDFDQTPLKDAIAWFRDSANLNIIIDELSIEEEGIRTTTPVTLQLKDVQAGSALRLMLRPFNLGVMVDDESGVVIVTSQFHLKGKMIAAAYPVADLVIPKPKPVVVRLSDGQSSVPQANLQNDPDEVRLVSNQVQDHAQLDFDSIGELITTVVEPDSWQEVGGRGTLRTNETTLSLVIRQTQDVHREISDLIDQLRRLRDVQVTLQMQPLELSQGFLADWNDGLEFEPLSEAKLHRYVRLSATQADELRKAGKPTTFPKVTLFNGQLCELRMDEQDGIKQNWHVQPVVSGDRRSVRLGVGIDDGRNRTSDEAVPTSITTVSDGDAILVELIGSTDKENRIVGEPIPGRPRAFRRVSQPRRFVLIQPKVVIVEEEEELLGVDVGK